MLVPVWLCRPVARLAAVREQRPAMGWPPGRSRAALLVAEHARPRSLQGGIAARQPTKGCRSLGAARRPGSRPPAFHACRAPHRSGCAHPANPPRRREWIALPTSPVPARRILGRDSYRCGFYRRAGVGQAGEGVLQQLPGMGDMPLRGARADAEHPRDLRMAEAIDGEQVEDLA